MGLVLRDSLLSQNYTSEGLTLTAKPTTIWTMRLYLPRSPPPFTNAASLYSTLITLICAFEFGDTFHLIVGRSGVCLERRKLKIWKVLDNTTHLRLLLGPRLTRIVALGKQTIVRRAPLSVATKVGHRHRRLTPSQASSQSADHYF